MRRAFGVVLLLAWATGCAQAPSQLLVVVDSDLAASRRACVRVEIAPADAPLSVDVQTFQLEADRPPRATLPFSFGVTAPGGDPARRVELRVSALSSGGACTAASFDPSAVTVTRRVRAGFVRGQMLRLPVFLAANCDGVICGSSQTCEAGACVAVPEIDPTTLAVTRPGEELRDAGALDAAREDAGADAGRDAGLDAGGDVGVDAGPADAGPADAGPADAGPGFSRGRPATALRSIEISETLDPHGLVYPVGVGDADHVLVAGVTESGLSAGGLVILPPPGRDAGIEDAGVAFGATGRVFLAKLSRDPAEPPVWTTIVEAEGAPYPVIRRVLPLPGEGYVLCGTAAAPFSPGGVRTAGSAQRWAFVARLDRFGAFVPGTVHVLDAWQSMPASPSPEVWCQDLALDGDTALVAARVWNADGLYLDGSTVTLAGGDFDAAEQNLLVYEIRSVASTFDVRAPVVVGRASVGFAQNMLHLDGAPLFARTTADGGRVFATQADDLDVLGSPATTAPEDTIRVVRTGTRPWSVTPLTSFGSVGPRALLRGLAVSSEWVWVAVMVQLEARPPSTVTFGALAPAPVDLDLTFLLRLDPATGEVAGLTVLPEGSENAYEDTGAVHARGDQLYGPALATTLDGHLLFATNASSGDLVDTTVLTVTATSNPQTDPLLAILDSTGAREGIWQWTDVPSLSDWRLTHVEWMEGGAVAIAGYAESTGPVGAPDSVWRREASFFQIWPTR